MDQIHQRTMKGNILFALPENKSKTLKSINGEEVKNETKSFKFVGVHLDEFIYCNKHTKMVKNKVSSSLYALNQKPLKQFIPS